MIITMLLQRHGRQEFGAIWRKKGLASLHKYRNYNICIYFTYFILLFWPKVSDGPLFIVSLRRRPSTSSHARKYFHLQKWQKNNVAASSRINVDKKGGLRKQTEKMTCATPTHLSG